MTRILAIANQKGGVGKTTTTISLGAALAELGRRVLLVDFDPQGALSVGLGFQPHELDATVYNVLMEAGVTARDVLFPTKVDGMDLLPSNIDLSGAEVQLVHEVGREFVLGRVLQPVIADYDVILIDCQPSLGLLTINALVAADRELVPLQCEFYALEGLAHLLKKTVKLVREKLNPGLDLLGILLTMFDGRTSLALQIREEVNRYFPGQVFDTVIPRNVRLTEAPSHGTPVMLHDLRSSGSVAYLELTREVLNHDY